jgi:hypothetical protein
MLRGRFTPGAAAVFALGVLVASTGAATAASSTSGSGQAPAVAAKGSVRLYLPDAFFVQRHPVTVPRRRFHVQGVVRPYVAGEWVSVRAFAGRRLFKSDRLRIKLSPGHSYGTFSEALASPRVGNVSVRVTHAATSKLSAFAARRGLAALDERIHPSSTGRFVQLVQQRLAALHLYIPQTGVYGTGTGLALGAYHRLLRWGTYQALDGRTISFLLNGRGQFKVRYPHDGHHAEGNLGSQLLALVDGARVYRIYPISSGKPSTPTILGRFRVYSRVPGYLPDGMYFSNFFIGGYAIHGYDPAPDYPASHGCMRLPIVDAISVYNWLGYGDGVDVYY